MTFLPQGDSIGALITKCNKSISLYLKCLPRTNLNVALTLVSLLDLQHDPTEALSLGLLQFQRSCNGTSTYPFCIWSLQGKLIFCMIIVEFSFLLKLKTITTNIKKSQDLNIYINLPTD